MVNRSTVEKANEVLAQALEEVKVRDSYGEADRERMEALGSIINGAANVLGAQSQFAQAEATQRLAEVIRIKHF